MTRDPERIDKVLDKVKDYWKEHPDLRLGQLIFIMASRHGHKDSFYIEDEALVREIQKAKKNDK